VRQRGGFLRHASRNHRPSRSPRLRKTEHDPPALDPVERRCKMHFRRAGIAETSSLTGASVPERAVGSATSVPLRQARGCGARTRSGIRVRHRGVKERKVAECTARAIW
jgi:hypothetical protein